MPRISPATAPDAQAAALLSGIEKKLGSTPNMFTTMAHSPAVLGLYINGSSTLSVTKISARLREQIALTAAGANNCDYCASAHTVFGKMHKLDDTELAANLKGKSSDAKTEAALTFVLKVIEARGHVADADIAAVRAAGYGDAEIGEIVAVTALNIFTNYFNSVMNTAVDFQIYPLIESYTKNYDKYELTKQPGEAGIPVGPVVDWHELENDPDLNKDGTLVKINQGGNRDEFKSVGMPFTMSNYKPTYKRAPDPGENNKEILSSLGYDPEQIEELVAKGVISKVEKPHNPRTKVIKN